MTIRDRCKTNVSKQTKFLDGIDVGPPKQRVCWRGLNRSVHEAMNNISNVKVHFKTRKGNVNIHTCTGTEQNIYFIDVNCTVSCQIHEYNNKFTNGHNRCIHDLTTKS